MLDFKGGLLYDDLVRNFTSQFYIRKQTYDQVAFTAKEKFITKHPILQ